MVGRGRSPGQTHAGGVAAIFSLRPGRRAATIFPRPPERGPPISHILRELKRRRLFQSLALYGALALGLLEAGDTIVGALGLPQVVLRWLVVGAIVGLPVAVVLGWAFDLTQQGLQYVGPGEAAPRGKVVMGRRAVFFTVLGVGGALGAVAGYAYWDQGAAGLGGGILLATAFLLVSLLVVAIRMEATAEGGLGNLQSVAVLPFKNLSSDDSKQYFADGMTEELINALANVPGLRTVARSTVFALAGQRWGAQEIGRQLGVEALVEGTARAHEDRLRITVQLVSAGTGVLLWAEKFDRNMGQIFDVQEEIAMAVVNRLRGAPAAPEPAPAALVRRQTANIDAYQLFLQGRFHWNQRTPDGIQKAIEFFKRALLADPSYALAHSGLADALIGLALFGVLPSHQVMPAAEEAARASVTFGPRLGEAHATMAHLLEYWLHDWNRAEREYDLAVEANARLADAWAWRGQFRVNQGLTEEGLADIREALRLEPLNVPTWFVLAMALFHARQHEVAIRECERILEIVPTYWPALAILSLAHTEGGSPEKALQAHQTWEGRTPPHPGVTSAKGFALGRSGRTAEAEAVLQQLVETSKARFVQSHNIALVHLSLGNRDQAIDWLERSYQERWPLLLTLRRSPLWDPLRSEPRFADLTTRLGFNA